VVVYILPQLETKEAFERHILSNYEDILNRTFQILYEVPYNAEWERIYRFSRDSNFIMVSGVVSLPKGTYIGGETLDEDGILNISCTLPWICLDDGSTAYQIVDTIKELAMIREIVGPNKFLEGLKSKNITMDLLRKNLPADFNKNKGKPPVDIQTPNPIISKEKDKNVISDSFSFNIDELTDEQKESLKLNAWNPNERPR